MNIARKGGQAMVFIRLDKKVRESLAFLLQASVHGQCCVFAAAMHQGLDWPIISLADGLRFVHAGVRSPEGKFWDGRGGLSEEEFVDSFSVSREYHIDDISKEELWARIPVLNRHRVGHFLRKAQLFWPQLPWIGKTFLEKLIEYGEAQEELAKKHGFWIGGAGFAFLPRVFEDEGDEAGYEIILEPDGNPFAISRVLR